jgi:hypothetical protein
MEHPHSGHKRLVEVVVVVVVVVVMFRCFSNQAHKPQPQTQQDVVRTKRVAVARVPARTPLAKAKTRVGERNARLVPRLVCRARARLEEKSRVLVGARRRLRDAHARWCVCHGPRCLPRKLLRRIRCVAQSCLHLPPFLCFGGRGARWRQQWQPHLRHVLKSAWAVSVPTIAHVNVNDGAVGTVKWKNECALTLVR